MLSTLKEWFRKTKKDLTESPISYWRLRFKDKYLNKKFVEQHRRVVYERAKLYIVYCILCLVITPIYLPLFGKESVIVLFSIAMATLVGVAIPTIIARFRIFATEIIMVTTIFLRGLTLWYIVKHFIPTDACVPFIFGMIRAYLNIFLLVSDMVLFRINFFTIFVAIPLYLFLAS